MATKSLPFSNLVMTALKDVIREKLGMVGSTETIMLDLRDPPGTTKTKRRRKKTKVKRGASTKKPPKRKSRQRVPDAERRKKVREVNTLAADMSAADACKKVGISPSSYNRWSSLKG